MGRVGGGRSHHGRCPDAPAIHPASGGNRVTHNAPAPSCVVRSGCPPPPALKLNACPSSCPRRGHLRAGVGLRCGHHVDGHVDSGGLNLRAQCMRLWTVVDIPGRGTSMAVDRNTTQALRGSRSQCGQAPAAAARPAAGRASTGRTRERGDNGRESQKSRQSPTFAADTAVERQTAGGLQPERLSYGTAWCRGRARGTDDGGAPRPARQPQACQGCAVEKRAPP